MKIVEENLILIFILLLLLLPYATIKLYLKYLKLAFKIFLHQNKYRKVK